MLIKHFFECNGIIFVSYISQAQNVRVCLWHPCVNPLDLRTSLEIWSFVLAGKPTARASDIIIYVSHISYAPMEVCMYFYQRLKDTREDLDKKQEDIALVLHITRQQYQLYESGKREMPMHHFVTLAKYYNVSLDYLAGLVDAPKKLK